MRAEGAGERPLRRSHMLAMKVARFAGPRMLVAWLMSFAVGFLSLSDSFLLRDDSFQRRFASNSCRGAVVADVDTSNSVHLLK